MNPTDTMNGTKKRNADERGPIGHAVTMLFDASRTVLGASMVLFTLDALVCVSDRFHPLEASLLATIATLRLVVRAWLRPGYFRALEKARLGGTPDFDTLTSGFDRFGSSLVVLVIGDLIIAASLAAGALPGVVFTLLAAERGHENLVVPGLVAAAVCGFGAFLFAWLGVRFAEQVVALDDVGPFTALARAWSLATGRRMRILRVSLFASGAEVAALVWGLASFGMGVLVSVPMARMVGDHALLGLLAELRAEGRAPERSLFYRASAPRLAA